MCQPILTISDSANFEVASLVEDAKEVHTITGFADFDIQAHYIMVSQYKKSSLKQLLSQMPKTLNVYLDNAKQFSTIDVSWYWIGGDYESSSYGYYQFSPKWGNNYVLSDKIDLWTDAPYIGVFCDYYTQNGITTLSCTGNPNETKVYNFLRNSLGCNVATACGILANIQCESSFNPNNKFLDTNGLWSYGLCQWNGDRYTALQNYSGSDYTTVDGQMRYLQYELNSSEKNAWNKMQGIADSSDGSYTAGYNWARYFERCAEYYNGVAQYVQRGNLARDKYWPEYGSSVDATSPVLKATAESNGDITLSWNAINCAGYWLYRATSTSGPWTTIGEIGSGSTTSKTDVNTEPGNMYYYKLQPFNSNRDGMPYSNTVSCTAASGVTLKATAESNGNIKLSWNAINCAGYWLYRATSTSGPWTTIGEIGSGSTTSRTDVNTEPGNMYYYKLQPFNSNRDGMPYSNTVSCTAASGVTLKATAESNGNIKLSWNAINCAGYWLYRATSTSGPWTTIGEIGSGSTTSRTDINTEPGNMYYYKLQPFNSNRDGMPYSNIVFCKSVDDSVLSPITSSSIVLSQDSYTYDGTPKKPDVTVKNGSSLLVNGTDYTIAYSNNINAGTASVSIIGKNKYTGTVTKKFTISKTNQTLVAKASSSSIKTGGEARISASGQGTISYASRNSNVVSVNSSGIVTGKSVGIAAITITATGNNNYYPSSTTITIAVTSDKKNNSITVKNFTKNASSKTQSFSIGAKVKDKAKLTYQSNNSRIMVNKKGQVTIAKNYVGTAKITITAAATPKYEKTIRVITITVNRLKQPLKVKTTKTSLKVKDLKKKKLTVKLTISKAQGKVTYKCNDSKYVTISNKGVVTLKKGAPKGKYKITVTASGKGIYASGSKTVTITVK